MKLGRGKEGGQPRAARNVARSVRYSTSPLLASKTPPWRSRFLVALVGLSFAGLLGRAAYVQLIGEDFFQRQGAARYAHKLELPASRGRINDRNGQVLAASVAVPSIWAFPKEVDTDPDKRREMMQRSGRSTYPQIFIGDTHVGGCDDMMALEREGKLDPLLAA